MIHPSVSTMVRRIEIAGIICSVLALLVGCNIPIVKKPALRDQEIEDVLQLSQDIGYYARSAGERLAIGDECRAKLLDEFRTRYFAPWTRSSPQYDPAETKEQMRRTARGRWYGENRRIMPLEMMRNLLDNCALASFPSRNETAIAVAPTNMRGLPTNLPLFSKQDGYPFDMLQYPNVKLNEPLRVLHASKDGIWLFVESAYSSGWLEARDVARADQGFVNYWMKRPQLVIVQDYASVADSRLGTVHRAKIGTILPMSAEGDGWSGLTLWRPFAFHWRSTRETLH